MDCIGECVLIIVSHKHKYNSVCCARAAISSHRIVWIFSRQRRRTSFISVINVFVLELASGEVGYLFDRVPSADAN